MKRKLKSSRSLRRIEIPIRKELFVKGYRRAWRVSKTPQDTVPIDSCFFKKIGIMRNERILVVAGCAGDWAKKLAEKAIVHYSDISKEMTEFVRKEKHGKIGLFRTRQAFLLPQLERKYDWSFFYEPIPFEETQLPIALMLSLLNNKGAKIVFSDYYKTSAIKAMKICEAIALFYNAKLFLRRIPMKLEVNLATNPKELTPVSIITLRTNDKARRKTRIDLAVMRELQGFGVEEVGFENWLGGAANAGAERLLGSTRLKRLGVSEEELEDSLFRIDLVSSKMPGSDKMYSVWYLSNAKATKALKSKIDLAGKRKWPRMFDE